MGLRSLRDNWDRLARTDPLWAVLSFRDKRGGKWNVETFFETGRREVEEVLAEARSLGATHGWGRALDFGCGVGRLSQALADRFDEVIGVDIAPAMVENAERFNKAGARCRFVVNVRPDLAVFPDEHFDFVYSNITLQHVPARYTSRYLQEFLRVLSPGGLVVFQLPSGPPKGLRSAVTRLIPAAVRDVSARLRAAAGRPTMQMHWMKRGDVESSLRPWPHRLLSVRSDTSAGPDWPSLRYFVQREARPPIA